MFFFTGKSTNETEEKKSVKIYNNNVALHRKTSAINLRDLLDESLNWTPSQILKIKAFVCPKYDI